MIYKPLGEMFSNTGERRRRKKIEKEEINKKNRKQFQMEFKSIY